jgi:hypothetical protein
MNLKVLAKARLLFSACLLSVSWLIVCEPIVGSLSQRGFGIALSLFVVGSWLLIAFGLSSSDGNVL